MKSNYDFSDAKRGAVLPELPGKERITIRLDREILEWFRRVVEESGGGSYQTMINKVLREYVASQQEPLETVVRRIVREELQSAQAQAPEQQAQQLPNAG